jgi:hypothetical protein
MGNLRCSDLTTHGQHIPGLASAAGVLSSTAEDARAIKRIFSKEYQPNAVFKDPLLKFVNKIVQRNAALFAQIKIQG